MPKCLIASQTNDAQILLQGLTTEQQYAFKTLLAAKPKQLDIPFCDKLKAIKGQTLNGFIYSDSLLTTADYVKLNYELQIAKSAIIAGQQPKISFKVYEGLVSVINGNANYDFSFLIPQLLGNFMGELIDNPDVDPKEKGSEKKQQASQQCYTYLRQQLLNGQMSSQSLQSIAQNYHPNAPLQIQWYVTKNDRISGYLYW